MMKYYLTILLFFISLCLIGQTTYYIDPAGDDGTGDGSSGNPWKTFSKAVTEVTTAGDTIFVNPGTYTSTAINNLSVGVSVIGGDGDRDVTILTSTLTNSGGDGIYNSIIKIYGTPGSAGNHYFKNLTFDGNSEVMPCGIYMRYRNDVVIDNCKFIDFAYSGIDANGVVDTYTEPDNYITGFEVKNCYFHNSSGYPSTNAFGALEIGGMQGALIHDNEFIQPAYTDRRRGILIKGVKCEHAGLKIYDNVIKKYCRNEDIGADDLPFAIELWDLRGGCEIYNNEIIGAIDLVNIWSKDNTSLGYQFGAKVYDNYIGADTCQQEYYPAIMLESNIYDTEVYRNYCDHTGEAISFSSAAGWSDSYPHTYMPFTKNNVKVYYNIFYSIGTSTPSDPEDAYLRGMSFGCSDSNHVWDSIFIENNIITNNSTYNTTDYAILMPEAGTITNFYVRNNIIMDMGIAVIRGQYGDGGTYYNGISTDNLVVTNNIIYNCGTNSYHWFDPYDTYLTNFTWSDNIINTPDWVSEGTDFNLQPNSPAINAGIDVGLTTDYADNPIVGLPDIGAYEWYEGITVSGILIDADGNIMIDSNGNIMTTE